MHFKMLLHKKTVSCKQALIDQWENIISDVYKDIMKVIFSLLYFHYIFENLEDKEFMLFFLFFYVFTLKVCEID